VTDLSFHDRDVLVTACGRLCLHRKRINISTVLAGQRLGIKEVDEGFVVVTYVLGTTYVFGLDKSEGWRRRRDSNPR
jgi:hypothetical protein